MNKNSLTKQNIYELKLSSNSVKFILLLEDLKTEELNLCIIEHSELLKLYRYKPVSKTTK